MCAGPILQLFMKLFARPRCKLLHKEFCLSILIISDMRAHWWGGRITMTIIMTIFLNVKHKNINSTSEYIVQFIHNSHAYKNIKHIFYYQLFLTWTKWHACTNVDKCKPRCSSKIMKENIQSKDWKRWEKNAICTQVQFVHVQGKHVCIYY